MKSLRKRGRPRLTDEAQPRKGYCFRLRDDAINALQTLRDLFNKTTGLNISLAAMLEMIIMNERRQVEKEVLEFRKKKE